MREVHGDGDGGGRMVLGEARSTETPGAIACVNRGRDGAVQPAPIPVPGSEAASYRAIAWLQRSTVPADRRRPVGPAFTKDVAFTKIAFTNAGCGAHCKTTMR